MKEHIQSLCGKIWNNGDCALALIELAERISKRKRAVLETIITLMDKGYFDNNLCPQKGFDEIILFLTGEQFTHTIKRTLEAGETTYAIEVWGLDEAHTYFRLHDWDCLKNCKYVYKGKLLFYHVFNAATG
ncbi:MAG: hypothetical protein LBO67_04045 [Spirochaetaceae bacterium]|jgi:hypothetical protein|nr:hypothetical protein [Spirochaetaceae bacterium]